MKIIKTFESFSSIPSFQIFGSKSSLDYDVMIFVNKINDLEESKNKCEEYNQILHKLFKENGMPVKKVNCNLGILKNGNLIDTFKGTADECNNSLYLTYGNFKQFYPNQISGLINRDAKLKILRCFRIILSFLSRSEYRSVVKRALRGNLKDKINVIKNIDFTIPVSLGSKNISELDFYKSLAFQVGQTLSLKDNDELYSKEDIYNKYPELESFLKRDRLSYNFKGLQKLINELIEYAEINKDILDDHEFSYLEK